MLCLLRPAMPYDFPISARSKSEFSTCASHNFARGGECFVSQPLPAVTRDISEESKGGFNRLRMRVQPKYFGTQSFISKNTI